MEDVGGCDGVDLAQEHPEVRTEEMRVGEFLQAGVGLDRGQDPGEVGGTMAPVSWMMLCPKPVTVWTLKKPSAQSPAFCVSRLSVRMALPQPPPLPSFLPPLVITCGIQ